MLEGDKEQVPLSTEKGFYIRRRIRGTVDNIISQQAINIDEYYNIRYIQRTTYSRFSSLGLYVDAFTQLLILPVRFTLLIMRFLIISCG